MLCAFQTKVPCCYRMREPHVLFLPLFLVLSIQLHWNLVSSSCPMDLSYVGTFPWDTSDCHEPVQSDCCQTLRGVFGMGLAQYLNQTSMFYLPDVNASSSCLSSFQDKLASMSISRSVFHSCFNDTGEFANRPSDCAGIVTLDDWTQTVPKNLSLKSSCSGDLTGLTCSLCLEAGLKVSSYLDSLGDHKTKCFFFTVFYAAAKINDFGPADERTAACMLRLPLSRNTNGKGSDRSGERVKVISGVLVGGFAGACVAVALFLVYRKWAKQKKQDLVYEKYVLTVKSRVLPNIGAKWFDVQELEQATDGFSEKNKIGQGGFGVVYRGTLTDGTEVAVKQILDMDSHGDEEFTNEAEIISKIRHRNLLSLRGFCVMNEKFVGKRRYLVYDFMSNGSLDDHLFVASGSKRHLSWLQRKRIILDIGKGLDYLHYGVKPAIYHRDVKATNILLDSDMKARLGDFGLAKQTADGQSHLSTRVAGTRGYLAPEYALYGYLTEKTDVYSFGIVILEIMSSRQALDASDPSRMLITDWAWEHLKSGRIEEIFHESIRKEGPKGVMERFVHVGILCAHVMMALRPTIGDALKMLEGDIEIPQLPDRPLPFSHEMRLPDISLPFSLEMSISTASKGSSQQTSNYSAL